MTRRMLAALCFFAPVFFFAITSHAQPNTSAQALFKAAETGNVTEIRKLLASGVAVDVADSEGWTPLMVAAGEGKFPAVQALVKAGANVNAASNKGETPLIAAVLSGSVEIVKFLLAAGADKNARAAQGVTAADLAERTKKPELAKLLALTGRAAMAASTAGAPAGGVRQVEAKENTAADAFEKGRYEESVKLFQEVVSIDPKRAPAWHFLGQSLEKLGRKDEAKNAYAKSLELQPTGPIAERNMKMLGQLRRSGPPKLPPEISQAFREMILREPLFTSLPDTAGLKCESVFRTSEAGKPDDESTATRIYERGEGGVFTGSLISPKNTFRLVDTLAGIQGGAYHLTLNGKPLDEIKTAEGIFFPLKAGNRFSWTTDWSSESAPAKLGDSKRGVHSCEVLDVVKTNALGLRSENDLFRVKCQSEVALSSRKLSNTGYHICSQSLGLCPLGWSADAGEQVPDFVAGFTFAPTSGSSAGKRYFIKSTCSPLP